MKKVIKLFDLVAGLTFVAMVLVVCMQIFCRYVLKVSVPWTEELCRLLFMYVGFLGTAIAVRERELIVVDFLLTRMPPKLRKAMDVLIWLFTTAFYALVFWGAVKMYGTTRNTYYATMPWVSNGMMYISVIVGMGASLISMIAFAIHHIRGGVKQDD